MTDTLIYLFFAATALEFLFALWLNRRAQSVLDAFIANPQLHEAAGRPSDLYFKTFAKKPFPRQPKPQTQVFGCFRPKSLLILPKSPLNPPRTPHNQASGPPFRRKQAHLAC